MLDLSALPSLISRETLFGNPQKASPQISPNGEKMAYLAPVEGVLNVWVGSIEKEDYQPVTRDRDRGVREYFWGKDSQTIFYLQDKGGDEDYHFFGVDIESGETVNYTPFEKVQVDVLGHPKEFPDDVLLAINKDNPQLKDVYHLHLPTKELKKVAQNPGNFVGWLSDSRLQIRGGIGATPTGGFDLFIRSSQEDEWELLIQWDSEDSLNSSPLAFSKDGKFLYLNDAREANSARFMKLNLETKEAEVLAHDPLYDVSQVVFHPDTYEPQMVAFTRARREWEILDKSIESDIEAIKQLHSGDFSIYNRDNDNRTWLVGFSVDDGPVTYYTFDTEKKEGKFLFNHRPELSEYTLASMEPISFQARDGLTVHGYITFPPNVPRKNLPMVLNVHGGPWHRDVWGFDPEAQWMANRGYVCLQVNFRGSTGYGKEFLNAGDREWGGKMHLDLVDAVEWAVEQGFCDPEKVAIYGGSYGGYAALVGATFTPDLFCCAVDIVGPSNLLTFIRTIPEYWKALLGMMYKRVGHPEKEEEFLVSRSPLFHVDEIKIPMLIAQGANDPRVKQSESEQIVEAMKKKGIPHEYMLFPDEGHGFAKPENRLKFYRTAEKFLAQHLGGRKED